MNNRTNNGREFGGKDFLICIFISIVFCGGFFAFMNHQDAQKDHVSVLGSADGYLDAMSATINIQYGKKTLKKYGGQTTSVSCYGDPGETAPISNLTGVPVDGKFNRYAITEGVGRQLAWAARCVTTFPDGTKQTNEVNGGMWASPNRRTCRLRNLPCANE